MNNLTTTLKALLLIFVIYHFSGCTKNENVVPPNMIGSWKVVSFDDNVNSTKILKTDTNTWIEFNNGDNTMSFSKPTSTGGDVSVKNVTNGFVGKFVISPDNKIVIKDGVWTDINEPEWGRLFRSIVLAETYELSGDNLVIFYNQKENSITLVKTSI
jgi:hypothetical protein